MPRPNLGDWLGGISLAVLFLAALYAPLIFTPA